MTLRALLLGLGLGVFISAYTLFSDQIIGGQSFLTGNHLPAPVFGLVVLLLLGINPLLRLGGSALPLRPGELAVIVVMGMAVCAWPGSNFYRTFVHMLAYPAHNQQTRPAWHGAELFSYLPGGSPRFGEGHLVDAGEMAQRLIQADEENQPVLTAAWALFNDYHRRGTRELVDIAWVQGYEARPMLLGLNAVIEDEQFHTAWPRDTLPQPARQALAEADSLRERAANLREQREAYIAQPNQTAASARANALEGRAADLEALAVRQHQFANRHLLVSAAPDLLRPPPAGEGVLLNGALYSPFATDALLTGWHGQGTLGWRDLPWESWWPTLRLWVGVGLFLGLASLCLALIVHPQWSQRELLPYPTVRFVDEVTATDQGKWLPRVAYTQLFWIGFIAVAALHMSNGAQQWFPMLPEVAREFDFWPLSDALFPSAREVSFGWGVFYPTIYFSVIGFGFFIQTRVAFSLGMSLYVWVFLGMWMLSAGVPLSNDRYTIGANGTAIRFGAYVGMMLMIIYFGRWYYLNVITAAVGLPRKKETPVYSVWAARGMAVCIALTTFLLVRYGGLSPVLSVAMVGMFLMIVLVLSRINVETGLFYAQPEWMPAILLAGVFGLTGLGPEAMIVLVVATVILTASPREALMPYLSNALRMGENVAKVRPARLTPVLLVMVVLGLAVAGLATLQLQYNLGLTNDGWGREIPSFMFDQVATATTELSARDELTDATGLSGLDHIRQMRPNSTTVIWGLAGIGLVLVCTAARLRLTWWPIHPVLFLVWGTFPGAVFAPSFLIAAAVKGAVVKVGGERAHTALKPLMVGIIAGELLAILLWSIIGGIYYWNTGEGLQLYRIFPRAQ